MVIVGVVVLLVVIVGAYFLTRSSGSGVTTYTTTLQYSTSQNTTSASSSAPSSSAATTLPPQSYSVIVENSSAYGDYLANSTGWTLYFYTQDTKGGNTSACVGGCASEWPAFYASPLVTPPGLNASNFNTITTVLGNKQLTYDGWPLYLFKSDGKAGVVTGNGVGGFVVADTAGTT